MSRKIRIISQKMKYRKSTFPAIASFDDAIGNYLTGQHALPGETDGLTKEEIENPEKIPAKKREKYPFVIQADTPYHIKHMAMLEVGLDEKGKPINPRDYALFNFWNLQGVIASSKDEFKPDSTHIFYFEDRERDAEKKITKMDSWYDAMKKIKENTSVRAMEDLVLLLNFYIKDFNVNASVLSKTQIEEKIYNACMEHPELVLKAYDSDADKSLFILKLVKYNIISYRNQSYYDGDVFLGAKMSDVLTYIDKNEGQMHKEKWGRLLNKFEKNV